MKKSVVLVVLAALLLGGVYWLSGDEPPSGENRLWQEWHDHHLGEPGQAWLWLMGFTAPAGERPDEAGRRWLEEAERELLDADDRAVAVLAGSQMPWHDRTLALPDTRSLEPLLACRNGAACEPIAAVLAEHAELLARFRDWPVQDRSLHVAAPESRNIPPLQALTAALQLDRLAQLSLLLDARPAQARALAEHADRQLRAMLTEPPNLIVLMVGVRMLSDQTAWLLSLHRDGLIELAPDESMLADLAGIGHALQATLRGEFGLSYRLHHAIDESHLRETADWWERFQLRWLFKPQMTLNRTGELYRWVAGLDQPADLAAVSRGEVALWQPPWQPGNLFAYGDYNMLPEPRPLLTFIAQVHDLNSRLALARAWLAEPVLDEAALRRMADANPYGRDFGIDYDEAEETLCFGGPLEDDRQFRCISAAAVAR